MTLTEYIKRQPTAYRNVDGWLKRYTPMTEWLCLKCGHAYVDRVHDRCRWCLNDDKDEIVVNPPNDED